MAAEKQLVVVADQAEFDKVNARILTGVLSEYPDCGMERWAYSVTNRVSFEIAIPVKTRIHKHLTSKENDSRIDETSDWLIENTE